MTAARNIARHSGEIEAVVLGSNHVKLMAPPPAPGPPLHVHEDEDEAIYLLEGSLECRVGDQSLTISAGGVVLVPRGTWHTLANAGSGLARFLVILSPPGFGGYWKEVSQSTSPSGGPMDSRADAGAATEVPNGDRRGGTPVRDRPLLRIASRTRKPRRQRRPGASPG
jgi:quercetin dioxygenase-like cupin family protein